jgi:hypothetical protein
MQTKNLCRFDPIAASHRRHVADLGQYGSVTLGGASSPAGFLMVLEKEDFQYTCHRFRIERRNRETRGKRPSVCK